MFMVTVKNGAEYIRRINNRQVECFFEGERVKGPFSEHKAFKGLMQTQADLYDMQFHKKFANDLTYCADDNRQLAGMSFLVPKTKEDLYKRGQSFSIWAKAHHGFLGRSPDYMNTAIMAFYAAADLLNEIKPQYAQNLKNYYFYCRDHDITLSHAFIQPHASKKSGLVDCTERCIAAKVVEETKDGLIVSGAFTMVTQGITADEIFVYPIPSPAPFEKKNPFAFAFAVPNDCPGVSFICRKMYGHDCSFHCPLSQKYDEIDTIVILERVLVPHERIFFYGDERISNQWFCDSQFHVHANHQVICRYIAKMEFMLGTFLLLAETLDIQNEPYIINYASEAIAGLEAIKSLRIAAEKGASLDRWGTMCPAKDPLFSANSLYPKLHSKVMNMIKMICSSGLIMLPSEQDFGTNKGKLLDTYLKGANLSGKKNSALFYIARELCATSFATRQDQFEHFFFGSPITVASRLTHSYTKSEYCKNIVTSFINYNNEK